MLTNKALPALFNGVSQQPPAQRHYSQAELGENILYSVADGAKKRPCAVAVAKLMTSTPAYLKAHHIFRSSTEQYTVLIYDQMVRVFDINGTEKTVDTSTYPGVLSYLASANPTRDIHALTVADTTFLVNRTKTVATLASSITAAPFVLYITVKSAGPSAVFYVGLDGTYGPHAFTHTCGTTAADQDTIAIATALAVGINAWGVNWTATANNSTVAVYNSATLAPFIWTVTDSFGGNATQAFVNSIERYSDLPREAQTGTIVEVKGDASAGGKASFWVKFVGSTGGVGKGYWEETTAPNVGEVTALDATTMPVALVKLSSGNFRLERPAWGQRLVGSTATSAPVPSFVGSKINSIYYYRNRLGFLADENIIMSRANNLYNFWPKSGVVVADDDPIDATVNSAKVSILRHAVGFNKTLFIFSDSQQFQAGSSEILSPRTFRADPATDYSCSQTVPPVSTGNTVFFAYDKSDDTGSYAGVREYQVDATTITNVANEITEHVPQYIPRDVYRMSASTTEDILVVQSENDYSTLYVYKYLWNGDKKVQSAWSKWAFDVQYGNIRSAEFDRSTLWLTVQRPDGVYLEKISLQSKYNDTTLPFMPLMDWRVGITGTYNSVTNLTTFTLPYSPFYLTVQIVAGGGFGTNKGALIVNETVGGTPKSVFTAVGDWSGSVCYAGLRYIKRHRFSRFYAKDREDVSIEHARLQLRHLQVSHKDTYKMDAEVTATGRSIETYKFSGLNTGSPLGLIGTADKTNAPFRFAVNSRAENVTIDITNPYPYPSAIQAAEWEGSVTLGNIRR